MTHLFQRSAAALAALLILAAGAALPGCAAQDGSLVAQDQPPVSALPAPTTLTEDDKKELLAQVERQVRERAYVAGVDFNKWPDYVKKHQKEFDRADTINQFTGAVNRALNEFGISHIDLMSPKMAKDERETSFGGIGITIDGQFGNAEGIKVAGVREGGPADKAGLKEGDVITAVNGKSPVEQGMIKGKIGTDVKLTVVHPKHGDMAEKTEELTLTRAKVEVVSPPRLVKVGDDAAVIRLDSFTELYERNTVEKLFKEAKDLPLLVVDLRSNGGGAVTNLYHFLSLLLPRGTEVGTFINRRTAEQFEEATKEDDKDAKKMAEWSERKVKIRSNPLTPFAGKVCVLINGGSASASEITAAALKECRDAPLVGVHSAGAVLMSTYVPMKNGFQMKVPTSDYVTIKGVRIEHNPLQPDLEVRQARRVDPLRDLSKDDTVLKAIEFLRKYTPTPAAAKEKDKEPEKKDQ